MGTVKPCSHYFIQKMEYEIMNTRTKIACNGVKPKKSEIYLMAAELVDSDGLASFTLAVASAMRVYDYDDYYHNHDYDDYDYDYYDYDDYYDDYDYYYNLSISEKVIALLFLSAMYASKGE